MNSHTGTELHWVDGPWPGRLALAARPRGGDWLEDEMSGWKQNGVDTVFSLLTAEEEQDLDIAKESVEARKHGMKFLNFPILDRQVPASERDFERALGELERELSAGRNVVLHCRPEAAVTLLTAARGLEIPETPEQRLWIDRFGESFASH